MQQRIPRFIIWQTKQGLAGQQEVFPLPFVPLIHNEEDFELCPKSLV